MTEAQTMLELAHDIERGHLDITRIMDVDKTLIIAALRAAASAPVQGEPEIKLCYIKRWRTIVRLPAQYADEIVEALRATPVQGAGEPVAWGQLVQLFLRAMDTSPRSENFAVLAERMANGVIALYAHPSSARPASEAGISALDDASNACLELAGKHGFATGHGDTVADMIREFSAQIRPACEKDSVAQRIERSEPDEGRKDVGSNPIAVAASAQDGVREALKVVDSVAFAARMKMRSAKGPRDRSKAIGAEEAAHEIRKALAALHPEQDGPSS